MQFRIYASFSLSVSDQDRDGDGGWGGRGQCALGPAIQRIQTVMWSAES